MKIISVVGARPQFIKLAPLSAVLSNHYEEIIIHTGQHFDQNMSELFFDQLGIKKPKYNLAINSFGHGRQTGEMLIKLEEVFEHEKPSLVIVFGDTTSTLAGSLAAVKMGIKVLHIEAGLRSFNRAMPEEINRIVSDHTADYLFAPTETAMNNLALEGLTEKSFLPGDIMVNSMEYAIARINSSIELDKRISELSQHKFVLATFHRPYNVDNPHILQNILNVLGTFEIEVLFPVHPRTQQLLRNFVLEVPANIKLLDPLGYLEFILLQRSAEMIITDSGGIQKEAYILKKPCITLRSETEWVETVVHGWNLLLDPKNPVDQLVGAIRKFSPPVLHPPLFGIDPAHEMLNIIKSNILI